MRKGLLLYIPALLLAVASCNNDKLPYYGNKVLVGKTENGRRMLDSVYYTIPAFSFMDQNNALINANALQNQVLIADFFFTSCPSICPKMMQQMSRVYDQYKDNKEVTFLSFSIDPVRDSVARLNKYAGKLGIDASRWHLLTGDKDSIYSTAESMLVSAAEDPDAPGGHVHSGNFVLIDKQRHIRGYYNGVDPKSVDKLMEELAILLKEKD